MKLVFIYGTWSTQIHGPFDVKNLFRARGLTGSESSFFNMAAGLAELGHSVCIFCDTPTPETMNCGAAVIPIAMVDQVRLLEADAVIVWNEPQYLEYAPVGALRVCAQQLNDFSYPTARDHLGLVDLWVLPSEHHRQYLVREHALPLAKSIVIPNSVNLEHFEGWSQQDRKPRAIWCSSPDRGLHHLLSFWPEVKARVPDAELRIFYRVRPWIAQMRDEYFPTVIENARRARYIEEALRRIEGDHWGVRVFDAIPNVKMAEELVQARVLAYTCDTMRYTEGFGVSVLDACAAGCMPIISDVDALPSVHEDAATILPGNPGEMRDDWIKSISTYLTEPTPAAFRDDMQAHAFKHSRAEVAKLFEGALQLPFARPRPLPETLEEAGA